MACFSPVKGYQGAGGKLVLSRAKSIAGQSMTVPCGGCIGCRQAKAAEWADRIMNEARMHNANTFITLTYDQKNLPKNESLDHKDWQDFAKRLRDQEGRFRYFMCGEYGDDFGRPHYHAILFGLKFDDEEIAGIRTDARGKKYHYSRSDKLEKIWGNGFTEVGDVTQESAGYVARYTFKKQRGKNAESTYNVVDEQTGEIVDRLKPPYAQGSLKPGIGATYVEKYFDQIFDNDFLVNDNYKIRPIPRYYYKLLERQNPERYQEIKALHQEALKTDKYKENNTPERLSVREQVSKDNTKNLMMRNLK